MRSTQCRKTWMVDWMGEDNLSYCRVVLSSHKYERVKYNIFIIFGPRVLTQGFGPRVLDLGFWSLGFGPRVLDLAFWSQGFGLRILVLGFWSLDLYIKSESLFIVIHSFIVRSFWINIFVRILRDRIAHLGLWLMHYWFLVILLVDTLVLALGLHPLSICQSHAKASIDMNGNSEIEKGWLGFLPREGFPGYILCTCAWLSSCDLGYVFTGYASMV